MKKAAQSRIAQKSKASKKAQTKKTNATSSRHQRKTPSKKKKISVSQALHKIIDVVHNVKNGLKDLEQKSNKPQKPQQYVDVPFAEGESQSSHSKFFYTDDHNIDSFDDQQLYQLLMRHYPGISSQNATMKKNAIIAVLSDLGLMQKILDEYNMNVLDFFKFLFRLCPSVFRGLFIKKIQKTLKGKPYAQSIRFGKYSFEKHDIAKRCSIL